MKKSEDEPFNEVPEILDWGKWKISNDNFIVKGESNWNSENIGEQVLKTNEIKFTFFKEGPHGITPPTLEFEENGIIKTIEAQVVELQVGSPLAPAGSAGDTTQNQLDPIKDIIEEPLNIWRDILLPYGGGLLGIIAVVSLIYFLVKKFSQKEPPPPEPVVIIPAHETAMQKLSQLQQAELWQQGNIKEYQSQLTYIIREYLENRYEINALENTTAQIRKDLKKINLEENLQNDLQNILQVADLVKFAKAKPGASVHEEFMDKAKRFVLQTKKEIIIEENQEDLPNIKKTLK